MISTARPGKSATRDDFDDGKLAESLGGRVDFLKEDASVARHARRRSSTKRIVVTVAIVVAGMVVVVGLASLAALLAGYEPPGFEKEARRVRRYAREHTPDFSRAVEVLEPVGKQLGRSERWMRDRFR
jgi:hypothetical protein